MQLRFKGVVGNAIVQAVGEDTVRVTQLAVDFDSRSDPQEMKNKIIAVCKKYGFEAQ
jgi:hypothetical protein